MFLLPMLRGKRKVRQSQECESDWSGHCLELTSTRPNSGRNKQPLVSASPVPKVAGPILLGQHWAHAPGLRLKCISLVKSYWLAASNLGSLLSPSPSSLTLDPWYPTGVATLSRMLKIALFFSTNLPTSSAVSPVGPKWNSIITQKPGSATSWLQYLVFFVPPFQHLAHGTKLLRLLQQPPGWGGIGN